MSKLVHAIFCGDNCLGCNWFVDARNGRSLAISIVHKEIREGRMPPPSDFCCVDCGRVAREYDHRDYGRPLDVQPVCLPCNVRRGPGRPAWYVRPDDPPGAHRLYEMLTAANFQPSGKLASKETLRIASTVAQYFRLMASA